jgi:hypothetical protein
MFCNNCGEKGHIFKDCKEPTTSCGLILLNQPSLPTDPDKALILMVKRKHSMSYTEFIRGKYSVDDIEYIKKPSKLCEWCEFYERGICDGKN